MTVETSHPKTPRSKAGMKHSLDPQIFLQFQLSPKPGAKLMDPSEASLWGRDHPVHQLEAHVSVEHCQGLAQEQDIREEGKHQEETDIPPPPAGSPPQDSKDSDDSFSPTGVMSRHLLGRHDHLLEPLPNELFDNQDHVSSLGEDALEVITAGPCQNNSDSEAVFVSCNDVDLFSLVNEKEIKRGKRRALRKEKSSARNCAENNSQGDSDEGSGKSSSRRLKAKSLPTKPSSTRRSMAEGATPRRHSMMCGPDDLTSPMSPPTRTRRSSMVEGGNVRHATCNQPSGGFPAPLSKTSRRRSSGTSSKSSGDGSSEFVALSPNSSTKGTASRRRVSIKTMDDNIEEVQQLLLSGQGRRGSLQFSRRSSRKGSDKQLIAELPL